MKILAIIAVLLLTGCAAEAKAPVSVTSQAGRTASTTPATQPLIGRLNPAVTQATIHSTICVKGWTATVRPKLSTRSGYEHDHIIPLGLGGAPKDPGNLWFELLAAAKKADVVETRLQREVCAGKVSLSEAQGEIIDWKRAHG